MYIMDAKVYIMVMIYGLLQNNKYNDGIFYKEEDYENNQINVLCCKAIRTWHQRDIW